MKTSTVPELISEIRGVVNDVAAIKDFCRRHRITESVFYLYKKISRDLDDELVDKMQYIKFVGRELSLDVAIVLSDFPIGQQKRFFEEVSGMSITESILYLDRKLISSKMSAVSTETPKVVKKSAVKVSPNLVFSDLSLARERARELFGSK